MEKKRRQGDVSVIIAALNEEDNIAAAVEVLNRPLERWWDDWEILIFDDGSTDRTLEVARDLALRDPRIRVFHHERPRDLGGVFRHGLAESTKEFVILVNGKNDMTREALDAIFAAHDPSLVVIPYTVNLYERPLGRRLLSRIFTGLLNAMHGLDLNYYNHSALYPADMVRSMDFRTDSYAFQAEILLRLIRTGVDYVEVGVQDRFEPGRRSRAFSLVNMTGVTGFLARSALNAARWRLSGRP